MDSTTPQKHTAVYVYATRQDPPGNLADQLITCLEQATKQKNQQIATYVDIQPGYKYNQEDALAYAVHFVFEKGESTSLARAFVRLLRSDRHIDEFAIIDFSLCSWQPTGENNSGNLPELFGR